MNPLEKSVKMTATPAVYQPRKPKESQYYQCVEDHFETLEQVYDDRFTKQYGFFRPYIRQVIYRYTWPRPGLLCLLQGTVS
jgi:hypothetical protein